ncbi:MAG TPA: DNA polymerase III subunit delta' [Bacillota bacterium]|nr:DNA polymerase III subunit delta' [Bacillota bacterium]
MRFLRDIVGHRQIVRTLSNAVASGRVAHACLFAGPAGVGKETTALAFARALLCSRPAGGEACGECRECRQVEHGNHPDLCFVQPAGASIKIEQIRAVQRLAPYRSYQGGRKIFVIRNAETMTPEAANCLLKILEEPPADTCFILLSARPQALLPTIVSRCQQFVFKNIPAQELAGSLTAAHGLKAGEAAVSAALSGGSMGKALMCAESSFEEERNAVIGMAGKLNGGGALEILEMAGKLSENRERVFFVLEMLACWYRDLLIYRETGELGNVFNLDRSAVIEKEAAFFDTWRLVEAIEKIEAARRKIEYNANVRLTVEALFLNLSGAALTRYGGGKEEVKI